MPPIKLDHNTLSGRPPNWDWQHTDVQLKLLLTIWRPFFKCFTKRIPTLYLMGPSELLLVFGLLLNQVFK